VTRTSSLSAALNTRTHRDWPPRTGVGDPRGRESGPGGGPGRLSWPASCSAGRCCSLALSFELLVIVRRWMSSFPDAGPSARAPRACPWRSVAPVWGCACRSTGLGAGPAGGCGRRTRWLGHVSRGTCAASRCGLYLRAPPAGGAPGALWLPAARRISSPYPARRGQRRLGRCC